ncbi:MAG: hypothetical protein EB038_08600 [Cyclobacteriaceae bacterium]|nr:hypothetical protein [Cyclobacteriaceae bacterium]
MSEGCETLKRLWQTAKECNIEDPGILGTGGRIASFVQCKNVRNFMVMATLKCWEERGASEMPPLIITDSEKRQSASFFNGKATGKK